MAAERPRRFAALAAQAPASPAHGLKRAEAQIEQAAVERVNLSTYPKDHPIWQDLHFCPDGPEAMFPDAQEAFAAAAASLGFEVEDTEMQEGGRGTEEDGVSDEWATVAALAVTATPASARAVGTMCGYFDEFSAGLAPAYAFSTPWSEGLVADATWVRGVGDYKKAKKEANAPVLAVSDGPGVSHAYMSALETLSGEVGGAREVFLYDQRGCGKSKSATDGEVYDLDLYLNELRTVVRELRLVEEGGAHVLAHGYWGARLATAMALERPNFAKTLTLVSPTASRATEVRDWRRALDDISPESRNVILAYEADLDDSKRDAYDAGMREFSSRFVSTRGAAGACFDVALAPRTSDAQRLAITGGRYFTASGSLASDSIQLDDLGSRLGANGVRAVRVVRGANDAVSESSAKEIVNAINANDGEPFCAYDEVSNAGSCVFLDRGDYFYESLNVCVELAEDESGGARRL